MTQRHGCYNCADEISDSRPTPTSEEQHTLDLAGVSVGATIGLREARKWRGRYACGVIVKGAAIRAEGEALGDMWNLPVWSLQSANCATITTVSDTELVDHSLIGDTTGIIADKK